MGRGLSIEELMEEIELKRIQLNEMVIDDTDKEDLLKFSEELDDLISRFYQLKFNKK